MIPREAAPVVVHRWFPDGEGWAHDPSLTADDILKVMQLFDRELKGTGEEQFAVAAMGRWLVGERRFDQETQDRLATHRSPTVFRVAFLRHRPSDQEEASLRQRLSRILPASRGIQPLTIELPSVKAEVERSKSWSMLSWRRYRVPALLMVVLLVGLSWILRERRWRLQIGPEDPLPVSQPEPGSSPTTTGAPAAATKAASPTRGASPAPVPQHAKSDP